MQQEKHRRPGDHYTRDCRTVRLIRQQSFTKEQQSRLTSYKMVAWIVRVCYNLVSVLQHSFENCSILAVTLLRSHIIFHMDDK